MSKSRALRQYCPLQNIGRLLQIVEEHTFKMVVAGMQCVSRSYSFARTCRMRAGERSSTISLAITSIKASQSGGGIAVFSETLSLGNESA